MSPASLRLTSARNQAAARHGAAGRIVAQRYDAHIVNKVQLLLDATLGLINVEQNNIIKVLTIVSMVGIPRLCRWSGSNGAPGFEQGGGAKPDSGRQSPRPGAKRPVGNDGCVKVE